MKRVYDIQQPAANATDSQRFRVALSRREVVREVVSDITTWTLEGREFYVAIRDRSKKGRRYVYHVNAPDAKALMVEHGTGRPVMGVVDMILNWIKDKVDFDITLLERHRSDRLQATRSRSQISPGRLLQLNPA